VVLFREPSGGGMNQAAGGNPVLQAAERSVDAGVITAPLEAGGRPFISAYNSVQNPALVVAVSLNRDELLADWRRQRTSAALAFSLLALTLAGIVSVAFRQMDARAQVEEELRSVQQLEAERLRDANQQLADSLEREQTARRETEQASYMKDEFLMTVSHELRTPLNAIYGWVRMLGSDALSTDQRDRAVAAVERNARAQVRLIEDLLDVSSSITGKLRLDARPTDIADAVGAAIETSRPALEAKSLQFEPSIEPGLPLILADPDRIQQIVWNLLSNAIKFTPEGGHVTLRVNKAGSSIQIAVTDTGVGIEPDFSPFMFERFRQGEGGRGTRRRYGGLGLGLAIVRSLAELHGGTVTAHSEGTDRGSTFRVSIPCRIVKAGDGEARSPEPEKRGDRSS
jgi:signal transduction histidine kinase